MRRTILDIDGIFNHQSRQSRPDNMFGAKFISSNDGSGAAPDTSFQAVASSTPKLDISQIAGEVALNPEEIEEIISGKRTMQ
jgi:hypothetical protein